MNIGRLIKKLFEGIHHDTLGVPETATPEEIRRAYFKISKENHPDKFTDPKFTDEQRQAAQEKFKAAVDAYAALTNRESPKQSGQERQKLAELGKKRQQHEQDHWEKYQIANGLTPRSLRSLRMMSEIDTMTGDPEKMKEMKEKMGSAYLPADHPHREHHKQWEKEYKKKYGAFESDKPETHPWNIDARDAGGTPNTETPQPEQPQSEKPKQEKSSQQSKPKTDPSNYKIPKPEPVDKSYFAPGSTIHDDPTGLEELQHRILYHSRQRTWLGHPAGFTAHALRNPFWNLVNDLRSRHIDGGRHWQEISDRYFSRSGKQRHSQFHRNYNMILHGIDHPIMHSRDVSTVSNSELRDEPRREGETQEQANQRADKENSKKNIHDMIDHLNDHIKEINHNNLKRNADIINNDRFLEIENIDHLGSRHLVGDPHFNGVLRKIMQHPNVDSTHLKKISEMMFHMGHSGQQVGRSVHSNNWKQVALLLRQRDDTARRVHLNQSNEKPDDSRWMSHREFMRDLIDHPADTDGTVAKHLHELASMPGHENAIDPHILEMATNRLRHGSSFGSQTNAESISVIDMVSNLLNENYYRSI